MKKQTFRGFTLENSSILSKEQLKSIKGGMKNPNECQTQGLTCGIGISCCAGLTCTQHEITGDLLHPGQSTYYWSQCDSGVSI